jgi:5-methylcytosine-specific restriction protein A
VPARDPNRPWRHWYGKRWFKARLQHLAKEPLCRRHLRLGQTVAATVVDHIKPHKGDARLFWDRANWQSLCKPCHDRDKQIEENAPPQCDVNGYDGQW